MDGLPIEIIQSIFLRLDVSPSELLNNISLVSKKWHLAIVNEWFLDCFFARRLRRPLRMSTQWIYRNGSISSDREYSDIPVSLGHGLFLNDSTCYKQSISSWWPPSVCVPCVSLSLWIWLPTTTFRLCIRAHVSSKQFIDLNLETDIFDFHAGNTLFASPDVPETLPCKKWTHVVFTFEQGQNNNTRCSAWINAKQHEGTTSNDPSRWSKSTHTGYLTVYGQDECHGSPYGCRLADLRLFRFILTSAEIQAITEQETNFDTVDMISYWKKTMTDRSTKI